MDVWIVEVWNWGKFVGRWVYDNEPDALETARHSHGYASVWQM
jgi:hypothetical protein